MSVTISEAVKYIGVDDKTIDLFESQYVVPHGVSYNSYPVSYTHLPFFIWTNYDTPEETVDITSLDYLSTMALERAGIELPAYNKFLADMQEVVPAINSRGYYSKSKGCYLHIDEAEGCLLYTSRCV